MSLKGHKAIEKSENLSEWDRDRLLIQLNIRLGRIRGGAYAGYGRYILPFAIAFTICGGMIYIAFRLAPRTPPFWLLFFGDLFLTIGIFLLLLIVMILILDFVRGRYLDSIDGQSMSEFECMHFEIVTGEKGSYPSCRYFNHSLDDLPLCIICPIYELKKLEK